MNKARILYIDDEVDLLEIAKEFFQTENYIVDTSSNLQEALQMIELNKYDIIISDENMPSGSGIKLLTQIRGQKLFNGKAILVTGNMPAVNESECKPYDFVVLKPVRFQELADKIESILA